MKNIKIKLNSVALGDTIACLGAIEFYQKFYAPIDITFDCTDWLWPFFKPSYPEINFESVESPDLTLEYLFDMPIQAGFAYQLFNIPENYKKDFQWNFVEPRMTFEIKGRPYQKKYYTFGLHSTAQIKYWNAGGRHLQQFSPRWQRLSGLLNDKGYVGVMVDKHYGFGTSPHWNEPPHNVMKRIGNEFEDVLNTIYHSEFFIGLSSGLSWVARALGKKSVMIAPFVSDINEFGSTNENHIRMQSPAGCTNCWDKLGTTFDRGDWYWCPNHKDTPREFECSALITPDMVVQELMNKNWI